VVGKYVSGAVLSVALLLTAVGCGSSTSTVVSPSSARCAVALTGGSSIAASGGNGTINVSAARECPWTASSDASWLTITSTPSGQGDGVVQYSAGSNPAPAVRRGAIAVAESRTELTQAAAPCQFAVTPSSFTFDAAGGDNSVTVATLDGCRWTAASGVPWISITGTQNPSGPGSLTFHVDANAGDPRTSDFVAAGQSIQVSQGGAAAPCTYALDPRTATIEATGGTTSFNVAARAGCGWTAVSQAPWIEISGNPVGGGNGTVALVVAANTGAARSGIVTVQGQQFTVTQAGAPTPCTYTITPASASPSAAGGPTSVTVTTQAGCTWTAASQASWIVVSSGSTGTGNGTVALVVGANTGAARTGTVSIAGRPFTVSQAAAAPSCTYSIAPPSFSAPATAATSAVDVTTQSGCAWTAASQAAWITVTAGASGTGNGRVELAIAANTGAARSGTVTIAGHTYTVNQAAAPTPCTYTVAPSSFAAPDAGGPTAVDVTTQTGCAWTAASHDAWITVTAGASGTGNGRAGLAVAANAGAARTGTVTVAGQTFTVNQAAAPVPCSYTVVPLTIAAPVGGFTPEVSVTTQSGCPWIAESQAAWITVTSGASGNANGRVLLSIAANTGDARAGTVAIAGQTVTVTQPAGAPACSYALTPPGVTLPAAGGATAVDVATQPACAWSAVSRVPWITVTSNPSGSGNARIELAVAVNDGAARSGTVTIGTQTFTVTQEGTAGDGAATLSVSTRDADLARIDR
jgi:hypothetical protein